MPATRPSVFSFWDALAGIGLLGLNRFFHYLLPQLPDPTPIHFDAAFHANGWAPKAALSPLIYAIPCGFWVMLFLIGTLAAALTPDPARARGARLSGMRGLLPFGASVLMGGCIAIPVYGPPALWCGLAVFLSCLLGGLVLTTLAQRTTDPNTAQHYRLGLFYVNAEDPRLLVEKRSGYGWTFNYAYPSAWLLTAVLVIVTVLIIAAAMRLTTH